MMHDRLEDEEAAKRRDTASAVAIQPRSMGEGLQETLLNAQGGSE